MSRRVVVCVLAVLGLAVVVGVLYGPLGHAQGPDDKKGPTVIGGGSPALASLQAAARAYLEAFNKRDARALAGLWASTGEYTGPDGRTVKGRENIQQSYVEFFKENSEARVEMEVKSTRVLAETTAVEEGTLKLLLPGREPEVTNYTAIMVREKDNWLIASVKETDVDPSELVRIADLGWLIGNWSAKRGAREVITSYRWDANKVYIVGEIEVKEDGKTINRANIRITKDGVLGALRSWTFESTGAVGEALWVRDGERWLMEASGHLPEGAVMNVTNIFVPVGPNEFTFQSVDRAIDGQALPDLPPLKVTRIK